MKRYRIDHTAYQNDEYICQERKVQYSLYPAAPAVLASTNAAPPGSVQGVMYDQQDKKDNAQQYMEHDSRPVESHQQNRYNQHCRIYTGTEYLLEFHKSISFVKTGHLCYEMPRVYC